MGRPMRAWLPVLLIFRKPRALTLFTGRAASVYDAAQTGQDLTEYMRAIHATHVIESSIFPDDARVLHPYIERHAETLRLVFANGDFKVLEVRR